MPGTRFFRRTGDDGRKGWRFFIAAPRTDLTLTHSSPKNSSMPSKGNSSRVRGLGMSATSYFLLAAQLLSLGHLLTVHHVTCPEHGGVIHAGQPHEALHGLDANAACRRSMERTAPRAESVHDHCLVCTSTHERFALLPPACHPRASIEVALPIPPSSESGPFAPVELIVLSPKNSPPTV